MSRSNQHARGHRTPHELPVAAILGRQGRAAGNRDLAARARELAGRELRGSAARAAALCAAVALAETTTVAAARRVLRDWDDGAPATRDAAIGLLDDLTRESP